MKVLNINNVSYQKQQNKNNPNFKGIVVFDYSDAFRALKLGRPRFDEWRTGQDLFKGFEELRAAGLVEKRGLMSNTIIAIFDNSEKGAKAEQSLADKLAGLKQVFSHHIIPQDREIKIPVSLPDYLKEGLDKLFELNAMSR